MYVKHISLLKSTILITPVLYWMISKIVSYYNEINSFFKINLKGRLAICYVKDRISLENIKILIEKYSSDPR